MGIEIHAFNFLRRAAQQRPLGDTITIGRQGLHVIEPVVREMIGAKTPYVHQVYCEDLLVKHFGATIVDSLDNSDFEQATHIHNMNDPLPESLHGRYDTVIDSGCLEHIYNAPQALKNCSNLCKPGGQIVHILPANNFCGHGFWQFSPELFFSLYSEKNGYSDTEVFLASLSNTGKWYQVSPPKNGKRVNVLSKAGTFALVRTVLKTADFSHAEVQQSDYLYEWENSATGTAQSVAVTSGLKQKLKGIPFFYKILSHLYQTRLQSKAEIGLNRKNPGLTVQDVSSCISMPSAHK